MSGQGDDERPRGQRREQRADARDAEDDPAVVVAGLAGDRVRADARRRRSSGRLAIGASRPRRVEVGEALRIRASRAWASSIIAARRAAFGSSSADLALDPRLAPRVR